MPLLTLTFPLHKAATMALKRLMDVLRTLELLPWLDAHTRCCHSFPPDRSSLLTHSWKTMTALQQNLKEIESVLDRLHKQLGN